MKKIEYLTPEQTAKIPLQAEKWVSIGLDTSPLNYRRAIDACKEAYNSAELQAPSYFLFPSGPKEALEMMACASKINLSRNDFNRLSAESPIALTEHIRRLIKSKDLLAEVTVKFIGAGFYGQHDAGYLSYYDFFIEEFGIAEKISGLIALAKEVGWCWLYQDIAIMSEKPIKLTRNSAGQLHNEKGPAIEYRDGTKVYSFNGVMLPEKWVLERQTMDPSEIFECEDTDKRAAGIALYGYERLKDRLDYKVIEGNPKTDIGALIEIAIPGLTRKGRFLEAICPRNGPVFLGIPYANPWDNGKEIKTAVGAQAFLAGLPEDAYQHPPIRT